MKLHWYKIEVLSWQRSDDPSFRAKWTWRNWKSPWLIEKNTLCKAVSARTLSTMVVPRSGHSYCEAPMGCDRFFALQFGGHIGHISQMSINHSSWEARSRCTKIMFSTCHMLPQQQAWLFPQRALVLIYLYPASWHRMARKQIALQWLCI